MPDDAPPTPPRCRLCTVLRLAVPALALLALGLVLLAQHGGEWLRRLAERELQARLAIAVRIAEPIEWSLAPQPLLTVRGLALGEAEAPELAIHTLTAHLAPAALWRGRIALDALELYGVDLHLTQDAAGWNVARWLRPAADEAAPAALPAIGRIALVDASVRLATPALQGELAGVRLTLGPLAAHAAGTLEAHARLRVSAPVQADLQLDLAAPYRLS